jgi:hypothetical protein
MQGYLHISEYECADRKNKLLQNLLHESGKKDEGEDEGEGKGGGEGESESEGEDVDER